MAENVFSAFSQYGDFVTIIKYIGWGLLGLVVAGLLTGLVILMMVQINKRKVVELNLVNRRVKFYSGRYKKNPAGVKMLWVGRLKKFIPRIEEEDVYSEGKKEVIFLIKDNNGLHHTARLPNLDELKEWYEQVYGIDVNDIKKVREKLRSVYLMPNPAESLDWLADQCKEAKREFGDAWWQSPTVMVIGTAMICAIIFIMTVILSRG